MSDVSGYLIVSPTALCAISRVNRYQALPLRFLGEPGNEARCRDGAKVIFLRYLGTYPTCVWKMFYLCLMISWRFLPPFCSLSFCSLSANKIEDKGTHELAGTLRVNQSLQELK